jgi:hypothetical protein
MANIGLATTAAVIDDPRADAAVVDGNMGFMWQAKCAEADAALTATDLDDRPEQEWDYTSNSNFAVVNIEPLKAIGPRPYVPSIDTALATWQISGGDLFGHNSQLWKEVYVSWPPRAKFLSFYDSRGSYNGSVGYEGHIASRFLLESDPNFCLRMFRSAPAPDLPLNGYHFVEVHVLGDGVSGQWSLVLPRTHGEGQRCYPTLYWRLNAAASWEPKAEFRNAAHAATSAQAKDTREALFWETVDGHILLRIGEKWECYQIPPECQRDAEPFIPAGPVRVAVYGHAATVNLTQLKYQICDLIINQAYAQYAQDVQVDHAVWASTPTNRLVAWTPTDTMTAIDENNTGTVGTVKTYRPRILFASTNPYRRAVAYLAEVDFKPVLSAGTTSPYTTQGAGVLVSAKGSLNNDWREAECTLTCEMERSTADAWAASFKGNNKISVETGYMESGAGPGVTAVHHTGYLTRPAMARDDQRKPERVEVTLTSRDGFVRLQRKCWQSLGCMADRTLISTFGRVLNQCGIPGTPTTSGVQSGQMIFTGDVTAKLPLKTRKGDFSFDFPPDTAVVEALNKMTAALGYKWGVTQAGVWFCKAPVTYSGTPDFTLDDDTADVDAAVFSLRSELAQTEGVGGQPFVNYVLTRLKDGAQEDVGYWRSKESHQTPAAANFIGDDWWHVFVGYDEQSADALASRIISDRLQRHRMLHFRSPQVALFPDHFVKVQATGINVPTDTVFQIVSKSWDAPSGGPYMAEFACKEWLG